MGRLPGSKNKNKNRDEVEESEDDSLPGDDQLIGEKENKDINYMVVLVSQYYKKAEEREADYPLGMSRRDIALCLLFEEYGENVVQQIEDIKSGEIKFVVKL